MITKRKQLDPEATRASILDAARQIFLKKGYAATSMSLVANTAGVTKSLIHHHFENKANLWRAVKTELFQEYGEAQQKILLSKGEPIELLKDSFETYFHFLKSHPEVVRFISMIHSDDEWIEVDESCDDSCILGPAMLCQLGVERLKNAQEVGLLREDVDPVSVLSIFFNLAEHWFESRKRLRCELEQCAPNVGSLDEMDEQYLQDVIKVLLGGILKHNF